MTISDAPTGSKNARITAIGIRPQGPPPPPPVLARSVVGHARLVAGVGGSLHEALNVPSEPAEPIGRRVSRCRCLAIFNIWWGCDKFNPSVRFVGPTP